MVRLPLHRPPFPVGWFAVAVVDELPGGALVPLAVFGQDLAVGRIPGGRALVTHSVCPHLGADLAAGGQIDDDGVVCPLHGWCFDHGGACTSAANGPIPETARLRVWPTEVVGGTVWAFNGRDGELPTSPPPVLDAAVDAVADTGVETRYQTTAEAGHRPEIRPGHPEDVLAGFLAYTGAIDGAPSVDDPGIWVGTGPDGPRARVRGPGTLVVRLPDGADEVVHVTPVDGFSVMVRTVTGTQLPDVGPTGADLSAFRAWYRRFDHSMAPAPLPSRSGRAARRRASAAGGGETPAG